jgi:two-component system, LytTR family, response regulator
MIKVIIIDDEKHCIITLQHILSQMPDIEILATTQDSTTAKSLIETHEPDIVFIDIEMPHLNGFDVLNQFEVMPFKVVFTTAYDQYAIKALRLNALDYLLKPIDKKDIADVIDKYKNKELITSKDQVQNVQLFANGIMQDTVALATNKGLQFVKINEIMYLQAESCYTHITMDDKTKHVASKTMSIFEEVLQDNPLFFRAHKSYIINLKYIKQYNKGEGGELVMQDGNIISLSRNRKQDFLNLFTKI